MNRNIWICPLILLVWACNTPRVLNREKAPGADLSTYKSFDFYNTSAEGDTMQGRYNDRFDALKDAVASELQERGMTISTSDPDLLVNIGIVIDEEVQTRETNFAQDAPKYIGQRRYSWKTEQIEVGRYRVGTATIDLIDAEKKQMVWTGAVEGVIPEKESKRKKVIAKGIDKLFDF